MFPERPAHSIRRALVAGAVAAGLCAPALAEPVVPMPAQKPSVHEVFAKSKSFAGMRCMTPDPAVTFLALPFDLRNVTPRQMIGQLLVTSFSGKTADSAGVQAAVRALSASEIGGVLFFRHNVGSAADVKAVNAALQAAHPTIPAMIAVDQEGGAVMRVKPSEGGPDTPSAETLAEGPVEEAAQAYEAMAGALADLGFTANFGPVVDLNINPDNPVIARFGRSYGADPETVARYAEVFITAHHEHGVGTALKHFPGHGSSTDDSHDKAIDLSPTWRRAELIPFRDLIEARSGAMVMVGHLALDGLSGPGDLPASLSPNAIDRFLRETLCFDGIVVSDDLAMDAVSKTWDATEAVRLMIEAGGDIALLSVAGDTSAEVARILDTLADHAMADEAFGDRVRHAYARVVSHKLKMAEQRARAARKSTGASSIAVVRAE